MDRQEAWIKLMHMFQENLNPNLTYEQAQAVMDKIEPLANLIKPETPDPETGLVPCGCGVLPYPIGTKVYIIIRHGVLHDKILENVVCGYSESEWQGSINKGRDSRFVICHNSYNMPNAYELRDVFLTREAAEAALAILFKKGKTSQGPEPGGEEA